MATSLKRTIYTHSGVRISPLDPTNFGMWVGGDYAQPRTVQSATMNLNIPRADVNVFGVKGVVDRPQLEAESATIEFSFIPELTTSDGIVGGASRPGGHPLGPPGSSLLPGSDIYGLIEDAISQTPVFCEVHADGVGEITNALMNSFSGEASIGSLPTMSMGFTGSTKNMANLDGGLADCFGGGGAPCPMSAGDLTLNLVQPKDINLAISGNVALSAEQAPNPLATAGASGNMNLINEPFVNPELTPAGESIMDPNPDQDVLVGCAQSASFSWDLPVEVILCLGADPKDDGIAMGNPPGTASFTVEALSLQLGPNVNAQNYAMQIGAYYLELANASVDSRTHNLAVGDLFGSYNYVVGGTADGFVVG